MKRLLPLITLLLAIFTSCGEEKDECKACDEALQHMAGKIANQFCNPISMGSAWSKITDECGKTYDDNYVGYMAETCELGSVKTPMCGDILNTSSFRETMKINYSYTLGEPDDTVVVLINSNSGGQQMDQQLITNESFSQPLPFTVYDGDNLELTLVHFSRGDTLTQDMVRFTFSRYNNWRFERSINVQYDTQTQQYSMNLENWQGS